MIAIETERFRGMVFYRRITIGPLTYEFDRMEGTRVITRA